MKLTEAKLKQMILEALKSSKFQDFGIPTPDEKLRSDLGDSNFEKIQSLDPDQSLVMKQSFDDAYPSPIKQESIEDILKSYGFEERTKNTDYHDFGEFVYRTFLRGRGPYYEFVFFYQTVPTFRAQRFRREYDSKRYPKSVKYGFKLTKDYRDILFEKRDSIQVPKMFKHDFLDVEERQNLESFLIKKEKDNIIKALEELT